jgi:excisionase family DNA binding protein
MGHQQRRNYVSEGSGCGERLLTLDEVSEKLQVSRRTVERHVAAGKLVVVKFERITRVRPSDLQKFIEEHRGRT